ncbi:MAG: YaaR family protein [Treponema sp.]|nr:YaaR family protein [Treponema sp.]
MSDINPLGASSYYSGLQNATSQAAKDAKKNEKTSSTKKISFSELKKSFSKTEAEREAEAAGYPAEIAKLSIEDAAVFLKDEVDKAGNKLSENQSAENIAEFKRTVKLFIKYVVENNYVEHKKELRGKFSRPMQMFSKFNDRTRPKDPRVIIQTINQKLDSMVRDTLTMQSNNLKILQQADEIKGLIIDLMQA